MKIGKKALAGVLAAVCVLTCGIGQSMAWMHAQTQPIVNGFVYGDVDVQLTEQEGTTETGDHRFTIVPGVVIPKDPKVTVSAPLGAEPVNSYVFVKLTEVNWPIVDGVRRMDYAVADGWQPLTGVDNVYWQRVAKDQTFADVSVLMNDEVVVSENLTKAEVDEMNLQQKFPSLTVQAYVCQADGMQDAADAWTKAEFN